MAYIQKNNPFSVTSCGRRRSYMMTDDPAPFKQSNKRTKGKGRHFRTSEEGAGMTAREVRLLEQDGSVKNKNIKLWLLK